MAHDARLGTCHLGAFYLGLIDHGVAILVGGTDRTSDGILLGTFQNTIRQDGPCQCSFDVVGFEPVTGSEVVIRDGGTGTAEEAGRILSRTRIVAVDQVGIRAGDRPVYRVIASDQWLLDRFERVTAAYDNLPISGIISDILTNFTDGGYAPGDVDDSFGSLSIEFDNVLVSEALHRVAQAVEAHLRVNPYALHIDVITGVDDGHPITLDNSATDFWDFVYAEDISQIRTRVTAIGQTTQATAVAGAGTATIAVEETGIFDPSGGTAVAGLNTVTYTGVSTMSGPGNLTGCSGITRDVSQGADVRVSSTANDATAQTALATKLGGGASGIATHVIDDDALSAGEVVARAAEDLALYKDPIPTVGYTTRDLFSVPGKTVTVSMTTPRALSATVTISEVSMTVRGRVDGTRVDYDCRVAASPDELTFTDFLRGQVD